MRQCIDKACGNRVAAESEDDGDRFDPFSNDLDCWPRRDDNGDVLAQQLIDKTWQPLRHALRRSRDQDNIAALDIAQVTKTHAKTVVGRKDIRNASGGRSKNNPADARYLLPRLLCTRRERPSDSRTAEERHELAPLHSST